MYEVTVTKMQEHIADRSNLNSVHNTIEEAVHYFYKICDYLYIDHALGEDDDQYHLRAGGVGHDYEVEIRPVD